MIENNSQVFSYLKDGERVCTQTNLPVHLAVYIYIYIYIYIYKLKKDSLLNLSKYFACHMSFRRVQSHFKIALNNPSFLSLHV